MHVSFFMQAVDKENAKICYGGGKTKITNQLEMVSIPPMPENASAASITFRNKHHGWKSYRMEIKIEEGDMIENLGNF